MANIFTRIVDAFRIRTKDYWTYLGITPWGESGYQPTNRDYLDSYEKSFLVFACVRKIAEKVADTKFQLYSIKGNSGKPSITLQSTHELLDLLAQVNPFTTKFEMIAMTQMYLDLLGNAYWLKVRSKSLGTVVSGQENKGKVLELWMLRPDRVRVIEDPLKVVGGYEYTLPDGSIQTFKTEDVIHFKELNPKSSLYGMPTVLPALEVIQSLIFSTRWNRNFFYNDAVPKDVMIVKGTNNKDQMDEFRKDWADRYGGVGNANKLPIVTGKQIGRAHV